MRIVSSLDEVKDGTLETYQTDQGIAVVEHETDYRPPPEERVSVVRVLPIAAPVVPEPIARSAPPKPTMWQRAKGWLGK